ncbi:MAG: TetR/AcrR family transcriptional regulator [Phycisphaerales bacterium]|nr:TetR/AcrR family transcriptional regulator [Phycisphaerales bacterium]
MASNKVGEVSAKERLLMAGGRVFRSGGFGGAGIDGLARAAGLTSGAFYSSFDSKAEAFEQVVAAGFIPLLSAIRACQAEHGRRWLDRFVDFYLVERGSVDVCDACLLPTLSIDVARMKDSTRQAYQDQLSEVLDALSAGFRGERNKERALALISILVGAALMTRALPEGELRRALLGAARCAAKQV